MNLRSLIAFRSRIGNRFCSTVVAPASAEIETSLSAPATGIKATVSSPAIEGKEASNVTSDGSGVSAPTAASKHREMYKKLSRLIVTGETVSETLNQFIMEGIPVKKADLFRCIKELRKFRRHQHALEIFDWMERRKMSFAITDHAVRLDLIAKTKGLDFAESYFNNLDPSLKNQSTYGALMNCYCFELNEEKAKTHFAKMDTLNLINNSLPFNNMMSMYMRLNQPEKIPLLVDSMKQRNISPCGITYSIWMQSLSSLNDMEGIEKIFAEMSKDNEAKTTWNTYANLAAIYTKAGLYEKAEAALKSMEKRMNSNNRDAYHFLMSLYAGISKPLEVTRVWGLLKKALPQVNNLSYLVMLQALSKLNDLDEIKKIFAEWESECWAYDMRLANIAINIYLKGNLYQEAEDILKNAMERCKGPFSKSRQLLMIYLLENGEGDKAMEHLKAAVCDEDKDDWKWSSELISLFCLHFEKSKDVEGAEEFCKLLANWRPLDSETVTFLVKTYVAAGKTCPDLRERLVRYQIEVDEEIEDMLKSVCP